MGGVLAAGVAGRGFQPVSCVYPPTSPPRRGSGGLWGDWRHGRCGPCCIVALAAAAARTGDGRPLAGALPGGHCRTSVSCAAGFTARAAAQGVCQRGWLAQPLTAQDTHFGLFRQAGGLEGGRRAARSRSDQARMRAPGTGIPGFRAAKMPRALAVRLHRAVTGIPLPGEYFSPRCLGDSTRASCRRTLNRGSHQQPKVTIGYISARNISYTGLIIGHARESGSPAFDLDRESAAPARSPGLGNRQQSAP